MMSGRSSRAVPVEDFVQALTAQLDRAQDLMAIKARTGRPLTFALKDIHIDLHVFWETDAQGNLLMRHAGPNETSASVVKVGFTTITRSMVEENTFAFTADEDPRALSDLRATLDEADRLKLQRLGVQTVGQLRRVSAGADPKSFEAYLGIPVMRLRGALEQAARPTITGSERVAGPRTSRNLLRIRGANLSDGSAPEVFLSGEPVEVLHATASELVVEARAHHLEGPVEVQIGDQKASAFYRLPPASEELRAPQPRVAPLDVPREEAEAE